MTLLMSDSGSRLSRRGTNIDGALSINYRPHQTDKSITKKYTMKRESPSSFPSSAEGNAGGGALDGKRKKRRMKKIKVDHTYRDFSKLSLESVTLQLKLAGQSIPRDIGSNSSASSMGHDRKSNSSFPRKLYEMVTNPDFQHIICFMPHGRSWAVLNKEALEKEVLPKYFNHSKFESFNRQVNGWGYKRLMRRGRDHKSYYHECFLRGRPELTALMVRLVNPGKRIPDLDGEPDFYDSSRLNPLPQIGEPAMLLDKDSPDVIEPSGEVSKGTNETSFFTRLGGSNLSPPHIHHQALIHPPASSSDNAPHWAHAQAPMDAFRLCQVIAPEQAPTHQQGSISYCLETNENYSLPCESSNGNQFDCQGAPNPAHSAPFQVQPTSGTGFTENTILSSSEWPGNKPRSMSRTHSFSSDSSLNGSPIEDMDFNNDMFDIFDDTNISDYIAEPDPLSEPLQVNPRYVGMDEYLRNIKKPGPLLEDFAGIYYSKYGSQM